MKIFLFLIFLLVVAAIVIVFLRYKKVIRGGRAKSSLRVKDIKKYPRTKSEAFAIEILESITGEKFPTVNPDWLVWKGRTLELDGYSDKLKIALEFSGPLHTKWYPEMEPYEKYYERIVKDIVKRKLTKKHNVKLIVVDISLPKTQWRNYIMSRLYDIGIIEDKPLEYISEIIVKPYRNKQIEKEINLTDIECAKKL